MNYSPADFLQASPLPKRTLFPVSIERSETQMAEGTPHFPGMKTASLRDESLQVLPLHPAFRTEHSSQFINRRIYQRP